MPVGRRMRDFRSDFGALERVLVATRGGERQIPLAQLATLKTVSGPAMIRNEDGLLTGYVYVDLDGRDPGGYVEEAARLVREKVTLPAGYAISWSGEYESIERVKQRLSLIVPVTLALILLLLYLNTRSVTKTTIVMLAVPFSAVGAVWFVYLLGYNLSVGVWVGLIALLGVDAATGVFMLLYLDLAYEDAKRENRLTSLAALRETVLQGAVKRLRPKFMHTELLDVARQQRFRPDHTDLRTAERRERVNLRARHARMQNVTYDRYAQAGKVFLVVPDREHIEQALRRMGVASVAGVDHVNLGCHVLCDEIGRTARGMAYHEHVRLHRRQICDRVEHRLTFGRRGDIDREVEHVGRQSLGGDLEGRARPRGRLEEEVEHRLPAQ